MSNLKEQLKRLWYWLLWHGRFKEGDKVRIERLPVMDEHWWPLWNPEMNIWPGSIGKVKQDCGSDGYLISLKDDEFYLPGFVLTKL